MRLRKIFREERRRAERLESLHALVVFRAYSRNSNQHTKHLLTGERVNVSEEFRQLYNKHVMRYHERVTEEISHTTLDVAAAARENTRMKDDQRSGNVP